MNMLNINIFTWCYLTQNVYMHYTLNSIVYLINAYILDAFGDVSWFLNCMIYLLYMYINLLNTSCLKWSMCLILCVLLFRHWFFHCTSSHMISVVFLGELVHILWKLFSTLIWFIIMKIYFHHIQVNVLNA